MQTFQFTKKLTKRIACAGCLIALPVIASCGGAPEPKAPEPEPEPAKVERPAAAPAVSQELGSIDEGTTQKTFERVQGRLLDCQKEGIKRIEVLAGDVRFFLRIGQDGRVRWAFLEDSTLGDRDTERCMMGVLNATSWPKPEGGEAEVRKAMSFEGAEARPPADWPSDRIASVLAKEADEALKCKEGVKGTFRVTAYVQPGGPKNGGGNGKGKRPKAAHDRRDKGKDGHAEAVGVAPPTKEGEAKIDCIVEAVKEWRMPNPGSYVAKVSFTL